MNRWRNGSALETSGSNPGRGCDARTVSSQVSASFAPWSRSFRHRHHHGRSRGIRGAQSWRYPAPGGTFAHPRARLTRRTKLIMKTHAYQRWVHLSEFWSRGRPFPPAGLHPAIRTRTTMPRGLNRAVDSRTCPQIRLSRFWRAATT
jgi:hypothetical protein